MQYWLMKSEPDVWSIDQQKKAGAKGAPWDGVRNYQAAKNLKRMKKGDLCFFYHSNIGKEIVGIVEVIKEAYLDKTDKSCRFVAVTVKFQKKLEIPVTLEKIKEIKALMESYSKNIIHIGPSGHGQLTKMVNQLAIASLIQGLSEGIALGKKSNLNMDKVVQAISGGAAQSWQMDNRFKTMVNDSFDFGFAVDLMIKDLNIALAQSNEQGINLPSSKSVLLNYKKLSSQGYGRLDTSSLVKLLDNQ